MIRYAKVIMCSVEGVTLFFERIARITDIVIGSLYAVGKRNNEGYK
jgi:hypothetical protein